MISPTTILEGYKLSSKAEPSLRNSGEKIFLFSNLSFNSSVKPIGIVDFITIFIFLLNLMYRPQLQTQDLCQSNLFLDYNQ